MHEPKCLFESIRTAQSAGIDTDTLEKKIWDEFGRTCAVLILDSTGFSRTTRKKGIVHFLSIIAKMREIGRDIFAKHGADGFRAEADNLYGEFPTAEQAVGAAFDMHRHFDQNPVLLTDDEFYRVCIGIGYGRLLQSAEEGMFGDEMNLASKLGEDTADGGQTLITEQTYLALTNRENLVARRKFVRVSGVDLPYFEINPLS